jgi:hypothetical protein
MTEINLTHANYDCIKYFPSSQVNRINCYCNLINDDDLKLFPELKELYCYNTGNITDIGLSFVPELTVLYLGSQTAITDNGFLFVPNLKQLFINDNKGKITNAGIQSLRYLEMLDCGTNTVLNDLSIVNSKNIRILVYSTNRFTKRSLSKLQLPFTLVIGDYGHVISSYSEIDKIVEKKGLFEIVSSLFSDNKLPKIFCFY